jgi:peptidoglycan/xylan/chitin deacetylase (PgdA/CDA1 family)
MTTRLSAFTYVDCEHKLFNMKRPSQSLANAIRSGTACALLLSESPSNVMSTLAHTLLVCCLLVACCPAQTPAFKVLPWNNHAAAVSLTFDDARPVQLDVAVPELNKRHLRATLFVTVSKLTRLDDWRKAHLQGHEIGNHSVSHEHPSELTKASEEIQVEDAKQFLESNFQCAVSIFAYPYAELSPGLQFWVEKYNFAARGWHGDGNLLYVTSDADPDWYNLPSQPVYTKYDAAVYKDWIDRAMSMGAWTTIQIHGIGDPSTGFEPIPQDRFVFLLDYLKRQENEGLWIAPFGEVAAYLRAQKILEKAQPKAYKNDQRFTWEVPSPFPRGVVVKVTRIGRGRQRLYQSGRELHPNRTGEYPVSFDLRELTIGNQ